MTVLQTNLHLISSHSRPSWVLVKVCVALAYERRNLKKIPLLVILLLQSLEKNDKMLTYRANPKS